TGDLLRKYNLIDNPEFVAFVNEQLLITAQNYLEEVNELFGAAALCYTNYGNYYMAGGLINLVKPLVNYLESRGGQVILRAPVVAIRPDGQDYLVQTDHRGNIQTYRAKQVISAIPLNNTLQLIEQPKLKQKFDRFTMGSEQLNSAFQMGVVFKKKRIFDCLHHQIHLPEPLPYTGSRSIFLSLSHPEDQERCGPEEVVASISTHAPDPAHRKMDQKERIEEQILVQLEKLGFFDREDIIYRHSSTPGAWEKWTQRAFGFVGGYPQYFHIKPWQMLDARLDHRGLYLAGDSVYPGQGIPGATLSGIIAYQKIKLDARG
ncbi:MAG: FAD-dependent oxidoreductase, partial [Bacteroidota bacterium]